MRSVASVSFGKDSLAMLLLLLERNIRLDEVIFYNSGMEFQAIYDVRDRVKPILEQRGIRFTEVNDLHPVKRTEKKYKIFPAGSQGCQLLLCRKA